MNTSVAFTGTLLCGACWLGVAGTTATNIDTPDFVFVCVEHSGQTDLVAIQDSFSLLCTATTLAQVTNSLRGLRLASVSRGVHLPEFVPGAWIRGRGFQPEDDARTDSDSYTCVWDSERIGGLRIAAQVDGPKSLIRNVYGAVDVGPRPLSTMPDSRVIKTALQWSLRVLDGVDGPSIGQRHIGRRLWEFYSLTDHNEMFSATERRELNDRLRKWAFSSRDILYVQAMKPVICRMVEGLSDGDGRSNVVAADCCHRVTGLSSLVFWNYLPSAERVPVRRQLLLFLSLVPDWNE